MIRFVSSHMSNIVQPSLSVLYTGLQILLWGNLASLDEEESTERSSALVEDESEFLR